MSQLLSLRSGSPEPLTRPSLRPVATLNLAPQTFCFSVLATAEPGVMPRVLNLFAKRGLVPNRWHSQVAGRQDRELSIDIQVEGLSPKLGQYIARCLDQLQDVHMVLTSEKR
jgi:acetolactate synthase small subunit